MKTASAHAPLCFVLMPFGRKPAGDGVEVDFDRVYQDLIAPAIRMAGLVPVRADEEQAGGIIHKPMFERLVLCEYAVADLTTANANVFYELGVRHAARPASTLMIFADGPGRLPFDVGPLRALPYRTDANGTPATPDQDREAIASRLRAVRKNERTVDSPLYQLLDDYPNVAHEKTDVFRDRVRIAEKIRTRLAGARTSQPPSARPGLLKAIEASLGDLKDIDSAVVIDLFLSYRDAESWEDMVRLARSMPQVLADTVLVREQLAFALNRAGGGKEAERVLTELIERRGASSETYGLLGRVYKDRWRQAKNEHKRLAAEGYLQQAIDAYLKGFEADWRDPFPGVNALTLMEIRDPSDPRKAELLPVVRYAAQRRCSRPRPDYWDHASVLELAIIANDELAAGSALRRALVGTEVAWHVDTTLRNLQFIHTAREERGKVPAWQLEIVRALEDRKNDLSKGRT